MGLAPVLRRAGRRQRGGRGVLRALVFLVAAVAIGLVAGVVWWSGVSVAPDPAGLARIRVQPLGGSILSAIALRGDGARIPLSSSRGRLLPRGLVRPGETVRVVVVVRRLTWLGWALGKTRTERLTLRAPLALPRERWLTAAAQGTVRLRFDQPIDRISYRSGGRQHVVSARGRRVVSLRVAAPSGTTRVASAARRWERLGPPLRVAWFPVSPLPQVLVAPVPDRSISPRAQIQLTFSRPLQEVLGARRPRFSVPVPGSWRASDSHTLVFRPSAFGYPLASALRLELPRSFAVDSGAVTRGTASKAPVRSIDWRVPGASFLRLQQLLADAGYLPVAWEPTGTPPARQPAAEIDAAIRPPPGRFSWRYPNTPPELQRLWIPGQPNEITRGAVMMFEETHGLAVDGFAGAQVWKALLADAIAGKKRSDGYSYVYVHRNVPQLLTLWHDGQTILTSPGNTGVPAAPTQLGTFPVFEHIPVGTMSGTNPNGSHYNDPGIRWISYFNGGDALHSFTRASFGTPQSLGCVELPLLTAAKLWPYTPIGTLVTIEG